MYCVLLSVAPLMLTLFHIILLSCCSFIWAFSDVSASTWVLGQFVHNKCHCLLVLKLLSSWVHQNLFVELSIVLCTLFSYDITLINWIQTIITKYDMDISTKAFAFYGRFLSSGSPIFNLNHKIALCLLLPMMLKFWPAWK